jgi:hypothetical protein
VRASSSSDDEASSWTPAIVPCSAGHEGEGNATGSSYSMTCACGYDHASRTGSALSHLLLSRVSVLVSCPASAAAAGTRAAHVPAFRPGPSHGRAIASPATTSHSFHEPLGPPLTLSLSCITPPRTASTVSTPTLDPSVSSDWYALLSFTCYRPSPPPGTPPSRPRAP